MLPSGGVRRPAPQASCVPRAAANRGKSAPCQLRRRAVQEPARSSRQCHQRGTAGTCVLLRQAKWRNKRHNPNPLPVASALLLALLRPTRVLSAVHAMYHMPMTCIVLRRHTLLPFPCPWLSQGIAPSAASLLAEPHVGIAAQARGMLVFTWGAANNSHDNVATQKAMRVNAVGASAALASGPSSGPPWFFAFPFTTHPLCVT